MEVTFIQRVLQVRLHCGPCIKVFITEIKMLLQSSVISICSIVPFLGLFSMERYRESLPILKDKIAYNSTIYNGFFKTKCLDPQGVLHKAMLNKNSFH